MSPDHVDAEIDRLERVLRADEPALVAHCRRLQRRATGRVVCVFVLLALGAVSLGVGLALGAPLLWCVGVGAYVLAAIADRMLRVT